MRIVIVGATGNVGTSVLEALAADGAVESILGIARRPTDARYAKTQFVSADVTRDDLVPHFRGADCVIHLAWLIQPSHDRSTLRATNVDGSARVLEAVSAAGVPAVVAARRHPDELVFAAQGRAGASARPLRIRARPPDRAAQARVDHEARERRGS